MNERGLWESRNQIQLNPERPSWQPAVPVNPHAGNLSYVVFPAAVAQLFLN